MNKVIHLINAMVILQDKGYKTSRQRYILQLLYRWENSIYETGLIQKYSRMQA